MPAILDHTELFRLFVEQLVSSTLCRSAPSLPLIPLAAPSWKMRCPLFSIPGVVQPVQILLQLLLPASRLFPVRPRDEAWRPLHLLGSFGE